MRVQTARSAVLPHARDRFRSRSLAGGIVLPPQQRPLRVRRIEPLATAKCLRIILSSPGGIPAEPVVRLGQNVGVLDLLGNVRGSGLRTYAPASGRVTDIGMVPTTTGRYCQAVELAVTQDAARTLEQPRDPLDAPGDLAGWAELCDKFGLVNAVAGEPLSECFRQAADHPVDHLIIRAVGIEPAETAPQAVLLEQGTTLIEAIDRLGDALGAGRIWIAVTRNFRQGRRLLSRIAHGSRATVAVLPDRYPQASVPLLVRTVCGRVILAGERPGAGGVCVVDTAAIAALAGATRYGLPPISSVVSVTGDAVARPADYRAPAGTTVGRLLEQVGVVKPLGMVIAGGPLSGKALPHPDVVLDPVTSCLTVLSNEAMHRHHAQACLRCGWCIDACPVGIDPAALMNLSERLALDRAAPLHPEVCLECGICSYVCPAQLDLARAAGDLKRARPAPAEAAP